MKIVDRYVARNFLFSFVTVLIGFLGLAVVIDASMNLDEFMEKVPGDLSPMGRALRLVALLGNWYAIRVLLFFKLLAPIIIVVSAVVTVVALKRRNEFVPLLASGVSVYRALWPVLALAFLVSGLGLANQELVLPRLAYRLVRKPDDPQGRKPQRVETGFVDAEGNRISADTYVAHTRTLNKVVIYTTPTGKGRAVISAQRAVWVEEEKAWRLEEGQRQPFDAEGVPLKVEEFGPGKPVPFLLFRTSLSPDDVDRPNHWIQLCRAADLKRRILLRAGAPALRVELHSRYVLPLHALVLLLLGLPLVLMQESRSVIVGLGIALVICLTYLGVQFVSEQMGSNGRLDPILAVWLPIFIFGPVAIVLFDSIRT